MGDCNTLFTAGQFSKMHHINKRTLHYYDDIGLFSPAHKGDNGYRYYTYQQSPALEMLLTLRELGMSIEEIRQYMSRPSAPAFRAMLSAKAAQIDDRIRYLESIRSLLNEREHLMALCEESDLSQIDIIDCPEEFLLLSPPINGNLDEQYHACWLAHMQTLQSCGLYHKSAGSMLATSKIYSGHFDEYDCFYTRIENPNSIDQSLLYVKPGGTYLRAFHKGDWSGLPDLYPRILQFADSRNLSLDGYSYEDGINELAVHTIDDYITRILIHCK